MEVLGLVHQLQLVRGVIRSGSVYPNTRLTQGIHYLWHIITSDYTSLYIITSDVGIGTGIFIPTLTCVVSGIGCTQGPPYGLHSGGGRPHPSGLIHVST